MKVQIYTGAMPLVAKSGVGQAILHQRKMLREAGVATTDRWEKTGPIHLNTVFPDAALTAMLARKKGRKVVYYGHSTMEDFRNSFIGSNLLAPLFKRWITFCYNLGDVVIPPTDYSKGLLKSYGIKKPVYSLTNGIDTEFFAPSLKARMRFRTRYRLAENEKVVISAGHFIERKGITAFVEMARRVPECTFIWFGHTPLNLVPAAVKEAIESAPGNCRFPGFVSQAELRDAYCGADLFAFLSSEETEGIVVLEALACGVPVLVKDIPVYRGWLEDGVNAYMAEDVDGFVKKAKGMLDGRLPSLTEAGMRTAQSRSMRATGEKLKAIYRKENI